MPKVLSAVYSYEDMKSKWNEDSPDRPYSRRDELQSGRYALDKWLIRVDDEGDTLAVIGWKEHSKHTVVGGGLTTVKGEALRGNMKALMEARSSQIPQGNMMVTALVHQSGNNERWLRFGRGQGYQFPNDSRFEEYVNQLPPAVKEDWLGAYAETFGIKPVNPTSAPEEVEKAYYDMELFVISKSQNRISNWFSLIKSTNYKIELGSAGFNVIRLQDNKRLNTIGLSRSQAKHMVSDLEAGKDVSKYTSPRKGKSTRSWKQVLRKWMPLVTDGFMELTQYKTKDSGNYESMIHRDLMEGKGDGPNRILVAGHYIYRGHQRVKTTDAQLYHWSQTILHSGKPTARSNWFYMTPNGSSQDFKVMFDMIPRGERLPQQGGMRTKLTNPTTQEVLVFTTIYDKDYGEPKAQWYDMWDEREEER